MTQTGQHNFARSGAKIAAYCLWFFVVLWASCLNIWPLMLVNEVERRLIPALFHQPNARIAAGLIIWLGFIFTLLWLPVWLMKRRRSSAVRLVAKCAVFLFSMLCCTAVCTILWQVFVTDTLYNCTDPGWLDYLFPGNWVHGDFKYVSKVVAGRLMTEPDTIKEGWSITGLWCLWLSWFALSVLVSALLSRWFWRDQRTVSSLDK